MGGRKHSKSTKNKGKKGKEVKNKGESKAAAAKKKAKASRQSVVSRAGKASSSTPCYRINHGGLHESAKTELAEWANGHRTSNTETTSDPVSDNRVLKVLLWAYDAKGNIVNIGWHYCCIVGVDLESPKQTEQEKSVYDHSKFKRNRDELLAVQTATPEGGLRKKGKFHGMGNGIYKVSPHQFRAVKDSKAAWHLSF
jgi:hypothetical protein